MNNNTQIIGKLNWQNNKIYLNDNFIAEFTENTPLENIIAAYRALLKPYPKFFKMDILSKAAFVVSEILLQQIEPQDTETNNRTAVILSTASGCIDVDKQFEASRKEIASPALFVYTLPNIMLGEICIKNKFKGEQLCTICEHYDEEVMMMNVTDLLTHRGTLRCLFGHIEVNEKSIDITLSLAKSIDK